MTKVNRWFLALALAIVVVGAGMLRADNKRHTIRLQPPLAERSLWYYDMVFEADGQAVRLLAPAGMRFRVWRTKSPESVDLGEPLRLDLGSVLGQTVDGRWCYVLPPMNPDGDSAWVPLPRSTAGQWLVVETAPMAWAKEGGMQGWRAAKGPHERHIWSIVVPTH